MKYFNNLEKYLTQMVNYSKDCLKIEEKKTSKIHTLFLSYTFNIIRLRLNKFKIKLNNCIIQIFI